MEITENSQIIDPNSYLSKDIKYNWVDVVWTWKAQIRSKTENIIPTKLGVTYGIVRVNSIESAFSLCFTNEMGNIIIEFTNIQGQMLCGSQWNTLD